MPTGSDLQPKGSTMKTTLTLAAALVFAGSAVASSGNSTVQPGA